MWIVVITFVVLMVVVLANIALLWWALWHTILVRYAVVRDLFGLPRRLPRRRFPPQF